MPTGMIDEEEEPPVPSDENNDEEVVSGVSVELIEPWISRRARPEGVCRRWGYPGRFAGGPEVLLGG